jgi:hypothetical protein
MIPFGITGRPPISLGTQRCDQPLDPIESFRKTAGFHFRCRRQGLTIRNTVDSLIGVFCQGEPLSYYTNVLHIIGGHYGNKRSFAGST